MNKRIIIPLIVILLFIIFLTVLLPFLFKTDNKKSSQQSVTQDSQSTSLSTSESKDSTTTTMNILHNNSDFKVEYSSQINKYVVTKKTTESDQKISDWLKQNNLSTTSNNVQIIDQITLYPSGMLISPTKTTDETSYESNSKLLVDLLNIFTNIGTTEDGITITPSISTSPGSSLTISPSNKKNKKESSTPAGKYVYYSQCGGGFDTYPLPSGCTVCAAGCGPTTVAMIAASYSDKSITPKTVVDLYKQKGYLLGCAGSRYTDAKSALGSYGIKTTDYMIFSLASIDTAAKDFKNYLNSGWTIFVLTNFCDAGCGHFFWITAISNNNDTWAYDPYYGKGQTPPYNEKSRYPFPKYRVAFGVKK